MMSPAAPAAGSGPSQEAPTSGDKFLTLTSSSVRMNKPRR